MQLIGMEDEFLSLMDDSGETREDLKCPDGDIGEDIRKARIVIAAQSKRLF